MRPKTAEAIALHALDALDAHLRGFQDHLGRQSDPDAAWTDKSGMFDTTLYRGRGETPGSAAAAEDETPDDDLPF